MKVQQTKILVAEDDSRLRNLLVEELSDMGFRLFDEESGEGALKAIEEKEMDVLILDLNLPGLGGIEVLKEIRMQEIPCEVVILTGDASVPTAVTAMKLGAYDYLTKPFKMEDLAATVRKACEKKHLLRENLLLKAQLKRKAVPTSIITQSPLMLEILATVVKLAHSDFPVLIHGESGTGKELVAQAVHDSSQRSEAPFIAINCGAIPENMLESELFGHEKGAFTGASAKKLGLMEMASQGTMFLDEIGEMPTQLQGKLLRAIETGTFFRVGGTKEVNVDVKHVSATNRDLKAEVDRGAFRADLYYRISALTVHIPPLRERREDIPLLIKHFTEGNPEFRGKKFQKDALKALSEYPWPGNVRELQNVIHRVLLLSSEDTITAAALPPDIVNSQGHRGGARGTGAMKLADVEREHILKVLKEAGGQRGKAAEHLGIDPKTLYRKLQGFGIKE